MPQLTININIYLINKRSLVTIRSSKGSIQHNTSISQSHLIQDEKNQQIQDKN